MYDLLSRTISQGLQAFLPIAFALAWFLLPVILIPSVALVFLVRPDPKQIAAHLEARGLSSLAELPRYLPRD